MKEPQKWTIFFLVIAFFALGLLVKPALSQTSDKMQDLQRIIEVQQKQLEMQQQQLDAQRKLLVDLQGKVDSIYAEGESSHRPGGNTVQSGEERVKLTISGHVSRAVNVVDDGKDTEAYFVDNDNSESRVNFVGTAKINEDLTLGSRIELTIAPNKASNVDQNTEETGDVFEQRWTELSLSSKRFGKVSLGKGFTASYGTASSDLSGTNVIATSTIADLSGGMLFRQKDDGSLTDIRIYNAFQDFNGLSRKNRLRYDTPKFYGAHLAVSAISDERYDAGLYWGGDGYGFQFAAAAGIADLNESDADTQYSGSFSALHKETGLNFSFAAGMKERDSQDDATNLFMKAGWLTDFFAAGKTAFSIDYTIGENLPTEDDEGESFGIAAVQRFDEYGTELFSIFRIYSLDRDEEPEVDDISVFSLGARVKF